MNIFKHKNDNTRGSIENHLTSTAGRLVQVYHEKESPDFHLDVYHLVTSYNGKPVNVLATSGMSDVPMDVPKKQGNSQYAELAILLPSTWKLTEKDLANPKNYWPILALKSAARLPYQDRTWIGAGHVIENGNPSLPYAEAVGFCGALVYQSLTLGLDFMSVESGGKKINFYALYPLYKEEIEYSKKEGVDALLELFDKNGVRDILDPKRVNVAPN